MTATTASARCGRAAALALAAAAFSHGASAFVTFGNGSGSKWDDPQFGTGAVVTWSFIAPSAGVRSDLGFLAGTNSLGTGDGNDVRRIIDEANGSGAFDAALQRAFATWAAAANLTFVQVADSGADFGEFAPGSIGPDIRIGAYTFVDGNGDPVAFSGGAGFGPPGNDLLFPDPLAGDLALNDFNLFAIAPGAEGDALPTGPGGLYLNDLEGLLLHEIGHTLGLGHSDVVDGVMCGYQADAPGFDGSACDYSHINRVLGSDDLQGIQTIYGPAPVPVPAALWMLAPALAGLASARRRR
ncbi:MAG: matrixin family metalloprotease [Gammaproteobacteria bacterium]